MLVEPQAAVKYGKKELAHPDARTGALRYMFTHGPVVFVTDSTCKEEITSYVLSAPEAAEVAFAELDGAPDKPTFADYVMFDTDSKRKTKKAIYHLAANAGGKCEEVGNEITATGLKPSRISISDSHLIPLIDHNDAIDYSIDCPIDYSIGRRRP